MNCTYIGAVSSFTSGGYGKVMGVCLIRWAGISFALDSRVNEAANNFAGRQAALLSVYQPSVLRLS